MLMLRCKVDIKLVFMQCKSYKSTLNGGSGGRHDCVQNPTIYIKTVALYVSFHKFLAKIVVSGTRFIRYDIFARLFIFYMSDLPHAELRSLRHRLKIYLYKSMPTMTSACACMCLSLFSNNFF